MSQIYCILLVYIISERKCLYEERQSKLFITILQKTLYYWRRHWSKWTIFFSGKMKNSEVVHIQISWYMYLIITCWWHSSYQYRKWTKFKFQSRLLYSFCTNTFGKSTDLPVFYPTIEQNSWVDCNFLAMVGQPNQNNYFLFMLPIILTSLWSLFLIFTPLTICINLLSRFSMY